MAEFALNDPDLISVSVPFSIFYIHKNILRNMTPKSRNNKKAGITNSRRIIAGNCSFFFITKNDDNVPCMY